MCILKHNSFESTLALCSDSDDACSDEEIRPESDDEEIGTVDNCSK